MLVVAVPSLYPQYGKINGAVCGGWAAACERGKGIEEGTLMTLSAILEQEIPQAEVAVLCGPSHAEEVGIGLPTTLVAGAKRKETAELVQSTFMNEVLRVYTSPDVLGMELGASLKT